MEEKAKILIVDDDPQLLADLKGMATGAGYSVACADNGASALALAKEERFNLIVTDIQMPRMDGPALMEKLRTRTPPTPKVIANKGYATHNVAGGCRRR